MTLLSVVPLLKKKLLLRERLLRKKLSNSV